MGFCQDGKAERRGGVDISPSCRVRGGQWDAWSHHHLYPPCQNLDGPRCIRYPTELLSSATSMARTVEAHVAQPLFKSVQRRCTIRDLYK